MKIYTFLLVQRTRNNQTDNLYGYLQDGVLK